MDVIPIAQVIAMPLAVLIGIVAGLRALTAPAAVSWAASLGWINLQDSWLSFLAHPVTPWVFTAVAILELIGDQLPKTPSRKAPPGFGARIIMGGLTGGAIATPAGLFVVGVVVGIIGAVAGTFGGYEARSRLAQAFGSDRPAALIEDAVAIIGAFLIVWLASGFLVVSLAR